jgi:hypothetical protein
VEHVIALKEHVAHRLQQRMEVMVEFHRANVKAREGPVRRRQGSDGMRECALLKGEKALSPAEHQPMKRLVRAEQVSHGGGRQREIPR